MTPWTRLANAGGVEARDGGIRVSLRCLDCGTTGSFRFDRAMVDPRPEEVDPDWDGVCFSKPATCAKCGAVDRYELVKPSARALRSRAVYVANEYEAVAANVAVVRASMRMWDGTPVRRPSQAFAHLRAQVEDRPTSGEAWRRLGVSCAKFGQNDESERALRTALEVDPGELNAAVELASLLWSLGREDTAFAVQFALRRWGETRSRRIDRSALAERLSDVMEDLARATDDDGSLEVAWAGARVGNKQVVHMSKVDLQKIDRWDRLAELLASGDVVAARIVPGLPPEEPTQLQALLDSTAEDAHPEIHWVAQTAAPAWRSSSKKRNKRDRSRQQKR